MQAEKVKQGSGFGSGAKSIYIEVQVKYLWNILWKCSQQTTSWYCFTPFASLDQVRIYEGIGLVLAGAVFWFYPTLGHPHIAETRESADI